MITLIVLLVLAADPTTTTTPPATTPPAPSAAEIKRVDDYFQNGAAGGPILMDFIPCKKAGRNADGKLTCDEVLGATAKKGDPLIAFVRFFVPKGGKYDDLKIVFLLDGEKRSSSDFTLSESWSGYANYRQATAFKAGTWEMQVLRGDQLIADAKVVVSN